MLGRVLNPQAADLFDLYIDDIDLTSPNDWCHQAGSPVGKSSGSKRFVRYLLGGRGKSCWSWYLWFAIFMHLGECVTVSDTAHDATVTKEERSARISIRASSVSSLTYGIGMYLYSYIILYLYLIDWAWKVASSWSHLLHWCHCNSNWNWCLVWNRLHLLPSVSLGHLGELHAMHRSHGTRLAGWMQEAVPKWLFNCPQWVHLVCTPGTKAIGSVITCVAGTPHPPLLHHHAGIRNYWCEVPWLTGLLTYGLWR